MEAHKKVFSSFDDMLAGSDVPVLVREEKICLIRHVHDRHP
jgi:hypothetical protein